MKHFVQCQERKRNKKLFLISPPSRALILTSQKTTYVRHLSHAIASFLNKNLCWIVISLFAIRITTKKKWVSSSTIIRHLTRNKWCLFVSLSLANARSTININSCQRRKTTLKYRYPNITFFFLSFVHSLHYYLNKTIYFANYNCTTKSLQQT